MIVTDCDIDKLNDYEVEQLLTFLRSNWNEFCKSVGNDVRAKKIYKKLGGSLEELV